MSKKCVNLILCIFTLLVGGVLYITLRPTTHIAILFGNIEIINCVQNQLSAFDLYFFRYYLPDFLWCFSLCCGLISIFNPKTTGLLICSTVSFICGSMWEFLQHINVLSGTFDFIDITMYLTAVMLAALINIKG